MDQVAELPGRRLTKSDTAFRTISEVSEELAVPQHVLRFWESRFTQIKPLKRGGGRRYYRPEDMALLSRIRDLLYKDGYTIKGVQKLLREGGVKSVVAAPANAVAAEDLLPVQLMADGPEQVDDGVTAEEELLLSHEPIPVVMQEADEILAATTQAPPPAAPWQPLTEEDYADLGEAEDDIVCEEPEPVEAVPVLPVVVQDMDDEEEPATVMGFDSPVALLTAGAAPTPVIAETVVPQSAIDHAELANILEELLEMRSLLSAALERS